jgi:hypothetical protein
MRSDTLSSVMLNERMVKPRGDTAEDINGFDQAFFQHHLPVSRSNSSGIPDASFARAFESLRHRETMLTLDKAIHEVKMRRRIASINSTLSPISFGDGLPTNIHGSYLPNMMPSTLNSALMSPTGCASRVAVGGTSGHSPLGGTTGFGRSLRGNIMNRALPFPTLTSSFPLPSLLSTPRTLQEIHQRLPVRSPGGSNLDRSTLDRLIGTSNKHRGTSHHS